jgi:hypothetical protein
LHNEGGGNVRNKGPSGVRKHCKDFRLDSDSGKKPTTFGPFGNPNRQHMTQPNPPSREAPFLSFFLSFFLSPYTLFSVELSAVLFSFSLGAATPLPGFTFYLSTFSFLFLIYSFNPTLNIFLITYFVS